jgi:SAM-dependent methyltransferase
MSQPITSSDVTRYLKGRKHLPLEDKRDQFDSIIRCIERVVKIDRNTRLLEVGTGTGWFPLLCAQQGWQCDGLELSQDLIDCANEIAAANDLPVNIRQGSIDDDILPREQYDVIIANCVFEHVQSWRAGLENIYRALRPGGVLFFESTNKFAVICGEYPKLPFYGWMPNPLRYRFRMMVQGPDIMNLGIDFNQFTYPQLRREFKKLGFSRILDRVALARLEEMEAPKKQVLQVCKDFAVARHTFLTFFKMTTFVCVK